ncbi:MAG: response regulator [Deltaproteobacteria bacterium]|nr:response regulator [Deltaproteobacteria bacterium]
MIRFFANRTMGFKLTFIFLSVILLPMLVLAYASYRVIDSKLMGQARERIGMGLKSAWTEYYVRGEQMRYGMLQAASEEEIKNAVIRRDRAYLRQMMTKWKQMRPYVDIWAVVDEKGNVIARLNSDSAGDNFTLNGMVSEAISSAEPKVATEILTREHLKFEGGYLAGNTPARGLQGGAEGGGPEDRGSGADVMALMVVTPVTGAQKAVGAIITGDVLNGDDRISDIIANRIPGLFTTISSNGRRISTNLVDRSGRNVRGTRIPESIMQGIAAGEPIFGDWAISGQDFVSVFEPIRNSEDKVIGSLDVGMPKENLWAIQSETQRVIAIITVLGLTVSLLAAAVSTYMITRPLKVLKDKISAFGDGDMSARIDVDNGAGDEIKTLARAFNSMMDEVAKREEDKGRYLKDIEEKNREFAELNEELKITNEELEVSYEETQSQTEELHAINEELKLLNEDLDRKNSELQRANRKIIREEEELKRAKDKLRFIYDSIRDYILLVDLEGRVLEANRQFIESFGQRGTVAGQKVYNLLGMETVRDCPIKRSIGTMLPVEAEMVTPGGKVLAWHAYPFIDGSESNRAVVYIRDITEQRLLVQKLMQSDKLSSLGELVSGVAHELNNPLTGITCFSELLMSEPLGEYVKTRLKKINEASHRCKKIIDNLLTFSRWKHPEKRYEDVNKVIRKSLDLRSYQLNVDNIVVELALDENIPRTMLDESQILQVFLNLANNASDAIKEKGGDGRIKISSAQSGGRLVIKFEDTGKGIPDDMMTRIFDPFFTTKGVGKGTGLGLSISYGIINEHGGTIYASSAEGAGSTFVVELPVLEEAALEEGKEDKPEGSLMKGRADLRALILDDEQIILDLLNDALCNFGFLVERAGSGDEALKKLGEKDYDLIISDIRMPGMDGKTFYGEVRRTRPDAQKKIIFISGDSASKETQEFLKGAGNVSLKKPFTVEELNEAVSRLVFSA